MPTDSYVFISYSKKQHSFARAYADYLLENGFDVWLDDRLDYGDNWWNEIINAINNCAALSVIMTPDAYESRWVQREVELSEQKGKTIFPLLLSGKNWERFVLTQYVDVTSGAMPPKTFLDALATVATRAATPGKLATPPKHVPIARRNWTGYISALTLILVVVAVLAVTQYLRQPGSVTQPTLTRTSTSTSAPTAVVERVYDVIANACTESGAYKCIKRENYQVVDPPPLPAEVVDKLLILSQFRYVHLSGETGRNGLDIHFSLQNTGTQDIQLSFDGSYFSLEDGAGRKAEQVYFCCATTLDVLPTGQNREIQVVFGYRPEWVGKSGQQSILNVDVTGFLPVLHARWSVRQPVTGE